MQPLSRPLLEPPAFLVATAAGQAKSSETLAPATRAAVILLLVGVALVGILLAAAILLGGHWVRRQGSPRRGPVVPPDRTPLDATGARAEVDEQDAEPPP